MRETKYILDQHGNPIPCPDVLTWGHWMQHAQRGLVLDEWQYPGLKAMLSTVFLGLDHGFDQSQPPLLYETAMCVFWTDSAGNAREEWLDYQTRYTTREEAIQGHEALRVGVENILGHAHPLPMLMATRYLEERNEMSYCRFSDMDFACDIYAYSSDQGYVLNVALWRFVGGAPHLPELGEVDDLEWVTQYQAQIAHLNNSERVRIDLPHAGESFLEPTRGGFLARLLYLRELGYQFPDRVIDELHTEMTFDAEIWGESDGA